MEDKRKKKEKKRTTSWRKTQKDGFGNLNTVAVRRELGGTCGPQ